MVKKLLRKVYSYRILLKNLLSNINQKKLFKQIYNKHHLKHIFLGSDYGGSCIPLSLLNKKSVCFCVGAGLDITFDLALIKQFECKVYSFDPTPESIKHIKMLKENTEAGRKTIVNNAEGVYYEISNAQLKHLNFIPIGIWSENKDMKFFSPKNSTYISHSLINIEKTEDYFQAECKTIKCIMDEIGYKKLSLLKLDVIGAEYEIINSLITDCVKPEILIVTYSEGISPLNRKYYSRINKTISKVSKFGYVITNVHGWEVTFVHTDSISSSSE